MYENARSILDADSVIGRRMEYQQRLVKVDEAVVDALLRDVIEEFALDTKWPAGQRDLDFALLANFIDVLLKQPDDVGRVGRRGNR